MSVCVIITNPPYQSFFLSDEEDMGKQRQDCLHLCFWTPWSGSIRCFSWKADWYLLNIFRGHSWYSPSAEMGLCPWKSPSLVLGGEEIRQERLLPSMWNWNHISQHPKREGADLVWQCWKQGGRSTVLCGHHWQWWGPLCRQDSLRTSKAHRYIYLILSSSYI